ncbi:lecithin retinol acyltransferase family protein [Corallococcus coralloides]|uniref:lecithin retinol acyltransferase family protein n=1 Tax=Corallococcus coralloides TaxID=184914 RepID=UPI00384DCEE1
MARDWASTLVELLTSPVSVVTDVIDALAGTPAHERFSNSIKTDVFQDSHLRDLDGVSTDRKLRPGTILRVGRTGFWHYGVYIGGDEVVHFTSVDSDVSTDNQVMRTPMSRFLGDASEFQTLKFPQRVRGRRVYSGRATCARAIEKIGMGGYSLLDNNCQHFAVWCKTGVAISGQTVLVNGGESDSAVYRAGIEAPALTGRLPALDRVPDLMGMFDIEVSRTLFASNYLP